MARKSATIRPYNTNVSTDNGIITVKLYATEIVKIDLANKTATFDNGGWSTPTTQDRMNSACTQYGIPASVCREKGTMKVSGQPLPATIKWE